MKARLLVACALVALPCTASLWINIGPEGGEARSFASDARTDTVFVLNQRSGVFRSTDGNRWTLVFDAVGRQLTPTRVAVDPQTSRLYVGTTKGLFRSDDSGNSWRAIADDAIIDVTASNDHLIISTPNGLMRSLDAGIRWSSIPGPPDTEGPIPVVRIDPRDFFRVIAAVGGSLFRSGDIGNTWERLTSKNIVGVTFGDSIYAVGSDGVYDCGTECVRLGADGAVGAIELAFWRGTLYAAISDGVLRFNYTVPRWERVVEGFPAAQVLSLVATPSALLVGTTAGVFQTLDDVRWSNRNEGLTNVRITAIAASAGTVVAGTEAQGIMRRGGGIWTIAKAGLLPARKMVTNGTTFYASFNSDGIFRSTTQGVTWDDISGGLHNRYVFDVAVDRDVVIVATLGGLAQSNDRGAVWRAIMYPQLWAGSIAIKDRIMVAAFVNAALVSTDGGATWSSTELPSAIRQVVIAGERAYATTDDALFVRTDGGWSRSTLPGSPSRINAIVASATRTYVSVSPAAVYFTEDGVSWTLVPESNGLPSDVTSLAVDETFLYAGTNGGSIFATLLIAPRGRAVRR